MCVTVFFTSKLQSQASGRHVGPWRTHWCRPSAARAQAALADGDPDGLGYGATPLVWRPTGTDHCHQDRGGQNEKHYKAEFRETPFPQPELYSLFDEGPGGVQSGSVTDSAPQVRVERHIVEHRIEAPLRADP